jgi:Tfp pilus assembly protein PilO
VRIILGVLLALNLVAAGLVLYPPGGSEEALANELARLQSQVVQKRAIVERTREHAAQIAKGREEGDRFLEQYFLPRRTAYTTLLGELTAAAQQTRIQAREHAWGTELIEGSDTLSMMTITANYEGSYRELMNFVEQLDRSPRLFIIETLTAAPQAGGNTLSVNMKFDTFVREDLSVPEAERPASSLPSGPLAKREEFLRIP